MISDTNNSRVKKQITKLTKNKKDRDKKLDEETGGHMHELLSR